MHQTRIPLIIDGNAEIDANIFEFDTRIMIQHLPIILKTSVILI